MRGTLPMLYPRRRSLGLLAMGALVLGTGCATLPSPAQAGPAADMAQRRIAAIAAGDTAAVMGSYADNAVLEWVGGPLDGRYAGQAAIGGVWGKFIAAQGPMQTRVGQVLESANPRGQTVVADVAFAGRMTVKVRYVMTYREGRLVSETWQVDPNLPG
ncbi:nuclear transport factor 2 family protein [Roseomonas pecuniae]|nr:nuclear transport factor 2 family protein [Roseomonas pecuniae]